MHRTPATALRRLETWLWTGPVGHLCAGVLDWLQAVTMYVVHALRQRATRARRGR